ncbi:MAG: ABC transporter permease [Anaerolineae bacterium]|nr:ABC transporter permease [Anaerolineae bacterium]
MNGFLAVVRKEFRHVLRDPWALAGTTLGTVVLMVLLAYAVSADIEHIPIAVMDGDRTPQSRAYVQRFVNDAFFDVRYWARSQEEAVEWVRADRVKGAIVIPAGFAESLQRGKLAPVQIVADGTEPNIALQIAGNAEALSSGYSVDLLERRLSRAGMDTDGASFFEFRVRTLYNPELREINAFLPGLIAIVLAFPALSAALSLVREREQGSLESLVSTPIRRVQFLAGKAAPYLIIGLLDILVLAGTGVFFFGVPFRGHLADLVFLSTLFLMANLGIGLLISSVLRTQMAALIVGGLMFMMPLTQSGLVAPLYTLPPDAQMQAMIWPATHYIIIARGIFLKGVGVQELVFHGLFLLALALLLNGLALWRFRKKVV